jgi:hypothetical protein
MVEKNPWWRNVSGPFPKWDGPIGCKEDGGGSHRGRGTVGKMLVHRAVNNQDKGSELFAVLQCFVHCTDDGAHSPVHASGVRFISL